ncbi:MAG: winged helix-turn-helix transcriptional regulator [Candidatus Thermoplasmatota archaeon]|nr:winged helix-turn-helix transcriptional regulator [Candidatus Thermoplasmatota archaeon]MCL5790672.1 winged helix-turn-helix transcriptional regulator [Candidatus Thermoplasmatota archaeon]
MDAVDKNILFYLLKDGRMPQRQIAKSLGISAQTLNYRMSKMIDEKIIEGFVVRVSPAIYGLVDGYAAFVTDQVMDADYVTRLKCLEKITLYGVEGSSEEEVNRKIESFAGKLGQPVMKYIPPPGNYSGNSRDIDRKIIDQLRKMPRAKISEVARAIDLPVIRVKRRYNYLTKNHLLSVIAKVDLSKTDIVLFSIFSENQEILQPVLSEVSIFQIRDEQSGVFVCFADNMVNARSVINTVREKEKNSDVMVVYDYEFAS